MLVFFSGQWQLVARQISSGSGITGNCPTGQLRKEDNLFLRHSRFFFLHVLPYDDGFVLIRLRIMQQYRSIYLFDLVSGASLYSPSVKTRGRERERARQADCRTVRFIFSTYGRPFTDGWLKMTMECCSSDLFPCIKSSPLQNKTCSFSDQQGPIFSPPFRSNLTLYVACGSVLFMRTEGGGGGYSQ